MKFVYDTGLSRKVFQNARLLGTWDAEGKLSPEWSEQPMREQSARDGAIVFEADVELAASEIGKEFCWRVVLDGPLGLDREGIVTEGDGYDELHRKFRLESTDGEQRYHLTHLRRLGARALRHPNGERGLGFAVWAPHAEAVEVVFGTVQNGYIADDGSGIDPEKPVIPLKKDAAGVWSASPDDNPALARIEDYVGAPYMYRIRKEGGAIAYRTDMYSRLQLGKGDVNPHGKAYSGSARQLDGVVSCSVVVDPGRVWAELPVEGPAREAESSEESAFWSNEFNHATPLPHRIDELVIYELHVGSLGYGKKRPGTFDDALAMLDYISELGVNCVELLPIAEANGTRTWGYGNSHHLAIQSSAGGPEKFREFVRACHQRGIAVIVDVVYNHYVPDGERAQWHYDSDREEHNIYYWYEGLPSDYPQPDGGYVDNVSSGYAPRYHEEMVRKLFISSAVSLVVDFHVDGFRVDQTTSIHAYNALHADGSAVANANITGAKFLRELSRTLRMIRPATLLTCEDHSDWVLVTEHPDGAGLGFDATWYSNFYHHLIGDTGRGSDFANLLTTAGMGGDGPLAMDRFASALLATGRKTVVYHESHDEAGNSEHSRRTLMAAIAAGRNAPVPTGETRRIAEARCRFAAGMTLLSAGTPMFLMGEEIGATKDFTFDGFVENREDLLSERRGKGSELFRFYRDLIRLRRRHVAFATPNLHIVLTHNDDRVIAFHRYKGPEHYLVVATLSDGGWPDGYELIAERLLPGRWREIFSSDSTWYGGTGVSNAGELLAEGSDQGTRLVMKLAARGFVVFRRIPDA